MARYQGYLSRTAVCFAVLSSIILHFGSREMPGTDYLHAANYGKAVQFAKHFVVILYCPATN